ncbi:16S rRNA (uracil(1498)-N(3))-methyltransferase [Peptoniphilus sp. oral taxon 386]|uniref:RsmE family RNA methyltransferase n=1 Tax=Peptoniphilus sp. oral taxon 386 TaxID=652713 RepID=UPI0001DA9C17|nr:RsmE family RNA methyltransferase [Peptoniphilus sp. oral taxon 386]EFI42391.1 RNA methyltransferase, RsmE family [Peptoniphilus sp. oral taxon 386 str. F0131]
MYRFFENANFENTITLSKENSHHYKTVLRIREEEIVEVGANNGVFKAIFDSCCGDFIILKKVEEVSAERESDVKLILLQGILKGDKMDQALKSSVEVGVCEIYPLNTKRVVAQIDHKEYKKVQRWQRVVEAAAKQSKRDYIPRVNTPIDLEGIEEILENRELIVPYENEDDDRLVDIKLENKNVILVIGPEGGFEETEIDYLKSLGAKIVSLGNRILRAETAAVCASFYIIYNFERGK